jgi:hypothetical protein
LAVTNLAAPCSAGLRQKELNLVVHRFHGIEADLLLRDPRTTKHVQAPLIQMHEQRGAGSARQNYEKPDHMFLLRDVEGKAAGRDLIA